MEFTIKKMGLINAISDVTRAISQKSNLPILKGVLIKAEQHKVTFIGTNLEIGIKVSVDAEINKQGNIVLDGKILSEIVRKLPDNEDVTITVKNDKAKLQCGIAKFNLKTQDASDYPKIAEVVEENVFELEEHTLRNMIAQTIIAIASENTPRPILTGILFKIENQNMNLVAIDGYRLALKSEKINSSLNTKAVIPGSSLAELSKIIGNSNEKLKICIGSKHALIKKGDTEFVTRLLEGDFIDYNQIIPKDFSTTISIKTKEIRETLERASLLAKDGGNNLVRVSIKDNSITFIAKSEAGDTEETLPVEKMNGDGLEIAFNIRFLLDSLKVIDSEEVYLNFIDSVKPCIINPSIDKDRHTHLILPVRIGN